ncbi:MAG: alpha/beta hydrolase [Anaerolineae bacterium]|nr:alpha/beta hydrolase [Anaerolineae bacterium]
MSIFNINGQPINVKEEGSSHSGAAVLIHGWSSSWYAVSPLLPTLSHRYHCYAVDLPGYGDSPPREGEPPTIVWYADMMADLIRTVSSKPVVLVGHSMGGMISLTLTLRHPELVERLVLLGPTISGDLSLFIDLFVAPLILFERIPGTSWLVSVLDPLVIRLTNRLMRPASFSERSHIGQADFERIRADIRRKGQGRTRAQCYWAMRKGDLRGKLTQISVPGLVIWGMEDNTVPLRDASVLADEWPDADLRIIPKASHWPQFETPDITERYIRAFLNTPLKLLQVEF